MVKVEKANQEGDSPARLGTYPENMRLNDQNLADRLMSKNRATFLVGINTLIFICFFFFKEVYGMFLDSRKVVQDTQLTSLSWLNL